MNKDDASSFMSPGHLYFAVVVGWVVEAGYCLASQSDLLNGIRAFFVVWFASAAGFFFGAALGFLFGFPRTVQNNDTPGDRAKTQDEDKIRERLAHNTNLEDVSDWVTKIIIGISIAEFGSIIELLGTIGAFVATGMGGPESIQTGNSVIAVSSILYGIVCGFIFYYYWARVALFNLLGAVYEARIRQPK